MGYPFGQVRIIAFGVIDAMGDDEMGEGGHVDFREAVSQWEELTEKEKRKKGTNTFQSRQVDEDGQVCLIIYLNRSLGYIGRDRWRGWAATMSRVCR